MKWKEYTVGFLIDSTNEKLLLIRKAKPEWQNGLLNGVGGSIEPGETPLDCMRREFVEETGIAFHDWKQFATGYVTCHQGDCICYYFIGRTLAPWNMIHPREDETEQASWFAIGEMMANHPVPNIAWLIPMGLIKLNAPNWHERATFITH